MQITTPGEDAIRALTDSQLKEVIRFAGTISEGEPLALRLSTKLAAEVAEAEIERRAADRPTESET